MILDVGRGLPVAPLVYELLTAPAGDVVDVARACRHLRIDAADLDAIETDLIEGAIAAAVQHIDGRAGILGRALLTQTWEASTNRPSGDVAGGRPGFVLALPPIQAVTKVERRVGAAYQDVPSSQWQSVRLRGERVAVIPADGASWPAADLHPAAWRVTFRAGYGAAADVPKPIVSAILLMVADLYDNRDGKVMANLVDNPTVERLLAPYRAVGV